MEGVRHSEPDVAIDTRPGIPSRVGLLRIVHPDSENVLITVEAETGGQVRVETGIPLSAVEIGGWRNLGTSNTDNELFTVLLCVFWPKQQQVDSKIELIRKINQVFYNSYFQKTSSGNINI